MMMLPINSSFSQAPVRLYKVKDGKMYIMLGKNISPTSLDSFITDYGLEDLNLQKVVLKNLTDSLVKTGWQIELNNNDIIALSKKLGSIDNVNDPSISLSINGNADLQRQPFAGSTAKFGINKFRNKNLFSINDSIVTFYLRNHTDAKKVMLAGSFNNWNETALSMKPVADGWVADVPLPPGKHWYKFIVDGHWMIDNDNRLVENDGKGNNNSVYFKPNYIFKSRAFANARTLYVAGSFNDWNSKEVPLVKTGDKWSAAVYLADGTYTYRFIADGQWSEDPENNDRFPNELGSYNSVIKRGPEHLFTISGFNNANTVTLLGSFNRWRDNELMMEKTNLGWQLPYALGPGNYEYTFKVDGRWLAAKTETGFTADANNAKYYNLVIEPNYTFSLKGFKNAKDVFIAGDFNNWSPNTYRLSQKGDEWFIHLYLDKGKHVYKYVIDGKWMLDPGNTLWEQNEYGTGNSVLWIE